MRGDEKAPEKLREMARYLIDNAETFLGEGTTELKVEITFDRFATPTIHVNQDRLLFFKEVG